MNNKNYVLDKIKKDKNSIDLNYKDITKDSYSYYKLDNSFIVFKSINNILYLIYATQNISIILYNLIDNKKINEIKNAHKTYITNFRHYLDKQNNKDLMISISSIDNNIKLWNINNLEIIYNFEYINNEGDLFSACFINDNNQINIISSNCHLFNTEPIKVFNQKGKKVKELDDSNNNTFFIDIYYDKINIEIYIITGNYGYAQSYNYTKNKIYKKYEEEYIAWKKNDFSHIIIYEADIIKLICSCKDSYIRIWDFHSAKLLNKIKIFDRFILGICIWDNDYVFAGSNDTYIRLIEIKSGEIIKSLKGHYREALNIKKIIHPFYGECLISQGYRNDYLKFWTKK